ncbi:unnamed protein product [Caenorhabditis sp. 36 PRJEB53466]|nr:unnamed protein product [Caenorhabditis sp. 36 PRJEB53466]
MSNNVSVDLSLEEITKKIKNQQIGKKLSEGNEKRFDQKGPATISPRRRSGGFQKKALPPTVTLNEKRNVRVEFTTAPTRNIGRKEQKSAKGLKKNGKRTEKPMKMTEQLDAELAAYMGKTENKNSRKVKMQQLIIEQLDAEMEEYMAKRTKSGPTEKQLLEIAMDLD